MTGINRKVWAWALYDWANSAFAVIVMAGFFPVFFKDFWSGDVEDTVSAFRLGMANSLSGLVVVLLAPSWVPSQTRAARVGVFSCSLPLWVRR